MDYFPVYAPYHVSYQEITAWQRTDSYFHSESYSVN
jgi:hypothetical protein